MGTAVNNALLAAALLLKMEFTAEEYEEFRVPRLAFDSYVKIGNRYFRPEGVDKRQEFLRQAADAPVPPSSARDSKQVRRPLSETLDAQLMLSELRIDSMSFASSVQELPVGAREEGNSEGLGFLVEEKAKFETERCQSVREGAISHPVF